ncbi:hypothetical protein [Paeniglutamicibacter sulfureus]|uniref:HNH nuclease domain-containing protein n=1 Tax=Paeniglutamicibacter sulfureus TaxID=43666 RepID=A0ABU2BLE3_9MICC|nr:hypothetical protein [Paeniglutamicibacter sulfureus]MDO2934352.1 hypothetical protein [Paeniglutamicibacter sulfureus]MDR7358543.1 hypothetical protein [Paeniglutamicibacter sulfureus]
MRAADGRFWSKVIKGPRPEGCWFWVGAISDDGYGRVTVNRDGHTRAVRPHRYAYWLLTGVWLDDTPSLMHDCDEPLCIHASADPGSHLVPGSHRENMLGRIKKRRHSNGTGLRYWGVGRVAQSDRSRRLRDELLANGWNQERIAAIRFNHDPDTPTLF